MLFKRKKKTNIDLNDKQLFYLVHSAILHSVFPIYIYNISEKYNTHTNTRARGKNIYEHMYIYVYIHISFKNYQ